MPSSASDAAETCMTSLNEMLINSFAQRVLSPQLWIATANGLGSAEDCLTKDIEIF